MKKSLSVLATIGIVASTTTSVIACGTKQKDGNSGIEEPKKDITQAVQDFEKEVGEVWTQHYEKEVVGNLIGVGSMEEGNQFLFKENILKFSDPEWKDKLTNENKKQLAIDIGKIFKINLLEEKLNELKKLNKYKIILDEVDSVFDHIELLFNDNFEINSGEIVPGSYIGNVIIDYKIVTKYKGLDDLENFKLSGTLKYTSTDNESFKVIGDTMYKNIGKDMFISSETENYLNLKWSDIKGDNSDSDAYLNSNDQLKKYYNENNAFSESLIKTIKDKYFKNEFPTMEIGFNKESIYRT
ncbi:hypothetical protein [Spiroplasma floricola]|uniref:Lipoprotein n=1 Tax=Spiroplasma floricola 23-6 TaxID=1336749 RepID=A0A2K8SEC2_9MOLU|nr:hypothetical protein [Spiroplasma floricola]AUB31804.1 hypothetical protein SFLOR_v1c07560 [Spiroplasma floricola 23-6]